MTRRYVVAAGLATGVVVLDLLTKKWASNALVDDPIGLIPGFLRLTYVENPGAAFSLFRDAGPYLGVAAALVVVGILWSLRRELPGLEVIIYGLIIGGAVGNLADRIFRGSRFLDGKVIDWIDLWWIPTFNIADMSITVAVGMLLIHAWRTR